MLKYKRVIGEVTLAGLLGLWIAVTACSMGSQDGDEDCDEPDDPPPSECIEEVEPNNSFEEANFVDVLPVLSPKVWCGELFSGPIPDVDFYYFFLSPNEGATEVFLNLGIETDMDTIPKVRLFQTIYDSLGNPTGNYMMIGQFVDGPGMLFLEDYAIPYDMVEHNDLFVVVDAFGPPLHFSEYEMQYWTY